MIRAQVVTPFGQRWLRRAARGEAVRLLHRFDRACNLVGARGEVLSVVAASLGPGPFAVVVPNGVPFSTLDQTAKIDASPQTLRVGPLAFDLATAVVWQPQPEWQRVAPQAAVTGELCSVIGERLADTARKADGTRNTEYGIRALGGWRQGAVRLAEALAKGDEAKVETAVLTLAGVGEGLTPAGDDVLLGAMLALWYWLPPPQAAPLAQRMAETAAPRTTTLSAAWLRAAARGEAGADWHELLAQMGRADGEWKTAVAAILRRGHTSGLAALHGFTAVLRHYSNPHGK